MTNLLVLHGADVFMKKAEVCAKVFAVCSVLVSTKRLLIYNQSATVFSLFDFFLILHFNCAEFHGGKDTDDDRSL